MAEAGADLFTFHIEATEDAAGLIKAIKAAKMKVGIAIKPKTPVDSVFPYVADVDLILVMTVEPGFGEQAPCILHHAESGCAPRPSREAPAHRGVSRPDGRRSVLHGGHDAQGRHPPVRPLRPSDNPRISALAGRGADS